MPNPYLMGETLSPLGQIVAQTTGLGFVDFALMHPKAQETQQTQETQQIQDPSIWGAKKESIEKTEPDLSKEKEHRLNVTT